MALSVEDGSGVEGANSFASLAQARAYAADRGFALTASDPVLTGYLVMATDWLKQKSYLGTKTFPGQSFLPFPRDGLTVDAVKVTAFMPNDIVNAACQLCIEQQLGGVVLFPTTTGPAVKREKIGPIETDFAVSNNSGRSGPRMPAVDALLDPWLAKRGFSLSTLRV